MSTNYGRSIMSQLQRLVSGLFLLPLFATCTPGNDKTYAHGYTSVLSSFGEAQLGEVCLHFASTMTAGNFFKGLEYRKPGSGSPSAGEFRKDGRIISLFPAELDILVGFHTEPCKGNNWPHLSPPEAGDLVRPLEIEASWKRGVELRPAELSAPPELTTKPTPFEKSIIWKYTFHIRARDVPLTDHLVVSIYGPEKKFLGRVTFDLISELTWLPGLPK